MASVNKCIIVGNLARDPETRYLANGDAVTNITVAVSESWKDKSTGEKKESVEWIKVVFFRKLAEIAGEYLKKGSSVYVEGKITTRKWTDKDGIERYSTEIVANEMQMLGGKPSQAEEKPQSNYQKQKREATRNDFEDIDTSIPF